LYRVNDVYCSPNVIRVIKSRMRRAGHVACMGDKMFWWGDLREGVDLEDLGVDGRILL